MTQVGLGFPVHPPNNKACGNGPPACASSGQADPEPPYLPSAAAVRGLTGGGGTTLGMAIREKKDPRPAL